MSEILSVTMSPRRALEPTTLALAQPLRLSKQIIEAGKDQVPRSHPHSSAPRSEKRPSGKPRGGTTESLRWPTTTSGQSDVLDELTDAFLTSARALVALAIKSINAAPTEITLMQH